MYISDKSIIAINSTQIAFPVGPEKDSYTIVICMRQNIETLETIVTCELIKNWSSNVKDPSKTYKEGTRFKEILYKGTYKECIQYFKDNVLNTQKEWIRDERMNYVYPD